MHHWVPLLDRFDEYLEKHVGGRRDLAVDFSGGVQDPPFPEKDVEAILRVTAAILEHSSNKHLYSSVPHLTTLLAAPSLVVVGHVLQLLWQLHRKSSQSYTRRQVSHDLTNRLLAVMGATPPVPNLQSWAKGDIDAVRAAGGIRFEFSVPVDGSNGAGSGAPEGPSTEVTKVIDLSDLSRLPEEEHTAMHELVQQHGVPAKHQFELLMRLREARGVQSAQGLHDLARVWLLACGTAVCTFSSAPNIASWLKGSTAASLIQQIAAVLKEETAVKDDIQVLAVRVVVSQMSERTVRSIFTSSILSELAAGGPFSLVAFLLRRGAASLLGTEEVPAQHSLGYMEAVLSLFGTMSCSSSSMQAVVDANTVPTLLPLLKDETPGHSDVVARALALMETLMEYRSVQ